LQERHPAADTESPISSFRQEKKRVVENFEKEYLVKILAKTNGNMTRAAKMAGIDVKNFHTKMKKYHLSFVQFRK
jgi:DNA-binding NtrC family response regulator